MGRRKAEIEQTGDDACNFAACVRASAVVTCFTETKANSHRNRALVPAANPVNTWVAPLPDTILTAVDTSARVYYLITCSYTDAYSKIFLATDLINGPKQLLNSSLLGNVTGEVPAGCQAVGYSTGDGPL